MARRFGGGQIGAKKKSGREGPESSKSKLDMHLRSKDFSSDQAALGSASDGAASVAIDRAASHGHADQQERHGPAGEEGEFGVVAAAEGAGDPQPEERDDEPDRPQWHRPTSGASAGRDRGT